MNSVKFGFLWEASVQEKGGPVVFRRAGTAPQHLCTLSFLPLCCCLSLISPPSSSSVAIVLTEARLSPGCFSGEWTVQELWMYQESCSGRKRNGPWQLPSSQGSPGSLFTCILCFSGHYSHEAGLGCWGPSWAPWELKPPSWLLFTRYQ